VKVTLLYFGKSNAGPYTCLNDWT